MSSADLDSLEMIENVTFKNRLISLLNGIAGCGFSIAAVRTNRRLTGQSGRRADRARNAFFEAIERSCMSQKQCVQLNFCFVLQKIQEDLLAHVQVLATHGTCLKIDVSAHQSTVDAMKTRVRDVQAQLRAANTVALATPATHE
jgi:hypothetical protein